MKTNCIDASVLQWQHQYQRIQKTEDYTFLSLNLVCIQIGRCFIDFNEMKTMHSLLAEMTQKSISNNIENFIGWIPIQLFHCQIYPWQRISFSFHVHNIAGNLSIAHRRLQPKLTAHITQKKIVQVCVCDKITITKLLYTDKAQQYASRQRVHCHYYIGIGCNV